MILALNSIDAFEDIMTVFDGAIYKPKYSDKPRIFDGYSRHLGENNK